MVFNTALSGIQNHVKQYTIPCYVVFNTTLSSIEYHVKRYAIPCYMVMHTTLCSMQYLLIGPQASQKLENFTNFQFFPGNSWEFQHFPYFP